MELHSLKRDEELANQTPTKLSKKEKKKQKEAKKLLKNKKMDLEKVSCLERIQDRNCFDIFNAFKSKCSKFLIKEEKNCFY